ncbi:MAG: hypothetical protein FJY81_01895 [Candidatus Aminicenantes bacterium]|nr:hypothetical protein [Candidatus Aminicenantes bacterium]
MRCAICALALLVVFSGLGLTQEARQSPAPKAPQAVAEEIQEFEGTVKVALGKYFYLPSAKGFDVVVQGAVEGQDASYLAGKEVRVKGELLEDEPSVLVADTIEIKEGAQYRTVFTRKEPVTLEDHIDLRERAGFPALTIKASNRSEDWEGKGKVKVFGKLEKTETPEGAEKYAVIVFDDKEKEIGKILIDSATDFARYYIKKLRLFGKFWFYIDVKETVDWRTRRQTRELFHADLLFAGLY